MTTHTPGPWHLSEHNGHVYDRGGAMITGNLYESGGYVVVALSPTGKPDQEKANGRLIAKSPELLIALDELATAVADARRRYDAGDLRAIESNALAATYRQAIVNRERSDSSDTESVTSASCGPSHARNSAAASQRRASQARFRAMNSRAISGRLYTAPDALALRPGN